MKKSKVKWEVKKAMQVYYKQGFTNTADKVLKEINERLDKTWK